MKKVLALILCLSVLLGFASCAKKVEVPSKSDVKKAAAEEYDMDFKVDSEVPQKLRQRQKLLQQLLLLSLRHPATVQQPAALLLPVLLMLTSTR